MENNAFVKEYVIKFWPKEILLLTKESQMNNQIKLFTLAQQYLEAYHYTIEYTVMQ